MIEKNNYSLAIEVFKNNNGILRMSEAMRQGVPKHMIYTLFHEGMVIREDRGLYRLDSDIQYSNPDLVKIGLLVPKAVICLISALYFYQLTTQIPSSIYIAIPRNLRLPKVAYPPIEVIRLSSKAYFAGIDQQVLDGVAIKIYSPEKTITDCFKFRSKIGTDIAIEALKDYMKKYRPKIDKLMEYARINRVEKLMRPYLEILV
jgi:predicted transcriptional regulator of viral defense system